MKRLRSNFTYANVMVTVLAVLVVGGGTAFAASQMLPKNSVGSKQIKKAAVTPAKLSKAAKATLTGPVGPKGATGATGLQGEKGERGERGEPGPAVQVLPSGKTEAGVFAASAVTGGFGSAALSFSPRLPGQVEHSHEIFVPQSATNGSHCPGFRQADPGYLCAYASFELGMTFVAFFSGYSANGEAPAEPEGTVIYFQSEGALGNVRGNWAYTAP